MIHKHKDVFSPNMLQYKVSNPQPWLKSRGVTSLDQECKVVVRHNSNRILANLFGIILGAIGLPMLIGLFGSSPNAPATGTIPLS
jgi:hypothetical protein